MNVVKTETVVREYDEEGNVVRETTTVVQLGAPPTNLPGMYL
jgi:hypothetical protein